jgi:hypothetical protein
MTELKSLSKTIPTGPISAKDPFVTRYAFLLLAPPMLLAFTPPVEEPRMQPNGWAYGEAGNYCMAIRELPGGARLTMRLAKWDDLSDSVILWKPGLPALDEDDQAAAERDYDLAVTIDGRAVRLVPGARMLEDFLAGPGPSYRIGIAQKAFIDALARGRKLEVRRSGKPIASFPIAGSSDMAAKLRACVAENPSF